MNRTLQVLLLCTAPLLAQDNTEKATVPLSDPSRPARIRVHLMSGGVTVKGYDGKEVLVESRSRAGDGDEERSSRPSRAEGMRRLQLPGNSGLDVTEEDNQVVVKTESWNRPSDLVITVPRRSSLQLKCMNNGDIYVEGVSGEIDANNLNGKVTLKSVSGSVLAHSLNGEITVSLDQIDPSKPMSFSTMNGDIDVTLPPALKANVRLKTDHGDIYSDFDVKLDTSGAIKSESGRQKDGSYHLKFDRTLRGTVNGGGPEFQFTSFNGQIYLRKRK